MKINRSLIKVLVLVAATGATALSCTDSYLDYNTNPYEPKDLDADGYALRAALQTMESAAIPVDQNTYQFTNCLLGGSFGGYLADSNSGFNKRSFAVYNPQDDWVKPLLTETVVKTYPYYSKIQILTQDPVPLAVANVIKVFSMHQVADAYGPIPYSKIGEDGKLTAPYDTPKAIYEKMLDELDSDIVVLRKNSTVNFAPKADLVYGGITQKWLKFANSLKLRLTMRISNVEPQLAKKKAEEAAQSELMETNDDNAFLTVKTNPLFVVLYNYGVGDSHISADILSYMNGYNDPRREKYFTKSTFAGHTDEFLGLRSGVDLPTSQDLYKGYSSALVQADSKLLWMNAAEIAFLRAEAALKGWSVGGSAESFYVQGIQLSFAQWGASGATQYIADNLSVPFGHVDPVNTSFTFDGTPSTIKIQWDESSTADQKLERIITQKWIANFPLGLEAWSDYRRTGYPRLMPSIKNYSGGTVDSKRMARRLRYPQVEYDENGANLSYAISNYLKGPDNMGTDLWWAKKN